MKEKVSPINAIWFAMILISIIVAGYSGKMSDLNKSLFESSKDAVTMAIGLIGPMAFWLGIMKVAEAGGLMVIVARAMKPIMSKLFPDVPSEHPAMSSMIMNMAANTLGLGNAATPMGIKAMQELERLSPEKGTASDSMILFLAINNASITLLPLGVITIRASAGCDDPGSIIIPTLLISIVTFTAAVITTKLMAKRNPLMIQASDIERDRVEQLVDLNESSLTPPARPVLGVLLIGGFAFAATTGILRSVDGFGAKGFAESIAGGTEWVIPIVLLFFLTFGYFRGVKVYETITEGAKEGFDTAVRIIPYMVAIFVAIGMIRSSGTLEAINSVLAVPLSYIGMPAEGLTMALIRPLSGSGAFAVMSEIVNNSPNSFLADLVCNMQGSTETTFYILAVYFGAAAVTKTRHALPALLVSDVVGLGSALFFTHIFMG